MTDDSDRSGRVSRRRFLAGAGALGATGLAGCASESSGSGGSGDTGGSGDALSGEIAIAGSSTVFPIAAAVAEKFQKKHPEVDITVQSTGSGGGFTNFFCAGKTDFNNASRPIKPEEKAQCRENGVEWHEITIATDAVTVVVNNEADFVDAVTLEELARIWGPDAGPDQTWSDVREGWPDKEISRFGPAETSGTFDYFTEAVMGETGAHTQDYQATEDDNTIVQGVAGNEYAIGYFGFSFFVNNRDKIKALAVDPGDGDPVEPTLENAKGGSYPLSRPLFTYPSKEAMAERHKAEFARFFTKQSANRKLIADQIGYVPNSEADMRTELEELNSFIEEARSG